MAWLALNMKCSSCGQRNLVFLEGLRALPNCTYCNAEFKDVELKTGSGFVYILSNPCMPGLLKIGVTERSVFERAQELSASTGVPAAYDVEACFPAVDASLAEISIHKALSEHRMPDREFFRVSLDDALRKVSEVCGLSPIYLRKELVPPTSPSRAQRWLQCRTCQHKWPIPEETIVDPPCPKCGWRISVRLREPPI